MSSDDGNTRGILHTVVHRAPWWVPWLFLFLAFFGWAIYQFQSIGSVAQTNQEARSLIRGAALAQCERINDLRVVTNDRTVILQDILEVAAESSLERGDGGVARRYLEHANRLEELPMVDCEEAFPERMERAGFTAGIGGPNPGPENEGGTAIP